MMPPPSGGGPAWPIKRCAAPVPRLTFWYGPKAPSTAACTSPPPCRLPSCGKERCSMPHDPVLVAETKAWLRKATVDLRAAQHDLSASPPLLADTAFHAQQAVEKTFKAFLMWHGAPFRKTHSLEELGEQCLDLDPTLLE